MKFLWRIFFVLILLTALTGCRKGDDVAIQLRDKYLSSSADAVFFSVTAGGNWTLSLDFGTQEPWAGVTPAKGSGSMNNVIFSYDRNEADTPREARLTLNAASGSTAVAVYIQAGKAADAVAGDYGYDVAPFDWLELPAMTAGDGREVLVHDMYGGKYTSQAKSGTRNWSCYWDYREHMSLWVAYPLNNAIKGSGSRSDEWGWDALLPHSLQPDLTQRSYGGGWTRGHQIPSADRLSPRAANVSTFVPTNMTPQEYNFNGGIWANLEGAVRSYAALSDTLYVVTGALWDQSTQESGSSSGFTVKVPTHYFKALLYSGTSAYAKGTDGFLMAAFLLPHDSAIAKGSYTDYRMSVDELEQKTGIDFFPALARRNKALSDKLEAAAPDAKFWN